MTDLHTYTASDTDRIRRFVIEGDEPLAGSPRRHRYATLEAGGDQPLAQAILAGPGVQEVVLENNSS